MPPKKSRTQPVDRSAENEGTEDHLHAQAHEAASDERAHKKGKSRAQQVVESTADQTVITGAQAFEILDDLLRDLPGPRRAKVIALDNAIWKQVAPAAGGSRKRTALMMGAPSEAAVQQEKKAKTVKSVKALKSVSKKAGHSKGSIVISHPSVPGLSMTSVSRVSSTNQLAAHHADEDVSANERESSVTESNVPWSEDEGDESDSDNDVTNDLGNKGVAKLTAAEKRFMAEQVFWSDNENNPPPGSSSTITTPKFVINEPINISDDGNNRPDDSPTPCAVPPNSPTTTIDPLQTNNISNLSSAPVNLTPAWPSYTNIVTLPRSKEILLSIQMYELKLVICKAMMLVEGRIRFDHAFPNPADRSTWNRFALAEACSTLESISHSSNVKLKYNSIKQRVEVDDQYVSDISTILDPRVSLLQGDTKAAAVINARAAYGLHGGGAHLVQRLLRQKIYIYSLALHGDGVRRNRPFEHNAIIGTLHDDLFGGHKSILVAYPDKYVPGEENSFVLTPSMIALAATAVFAALKEWETGPRIPAHFTLNVFAEVYRGHIEDLEYIKQQNELAYNSLLRRLFTMASGFGTNPLNNTIIDVDNMPVDVVV